MSDAASRMELRAALAELAAVRTDEVVIPTMSAVHVWGQVSDHPRDLVYLPSSMGQATSLALGLALARPAVRVVVLTGDGSLLMNLGSLVTIADLAPANLAVVVVANGVYQVTGSQPIPGTRVDWPALARGSGLASPAEHRDAASWRARLDTSWRRPGPHLDVLHTAPDPAAPGARSPGPVARRLAAFRRALG